MLNNGDRISANENNLYQLLRECLMGFFDEGDKMMHLNNDEYIEYRNKQYRAFEEETGVKTTLMGMIVTNVNQLVAWRMSQ